VDSHSARHSPCTFPFRMAAPAPLVRISPTALRAALLAIGAGLGSTLVPLVSSGTLPGLPAIALFLIAAEGARYLATGRRLRPTVFALLRGGAAAVACAAYFLPLATIAAAVVASRTTTGAMGAVAGASVMLGLVVAEATAASARLAPARARERAGGSGGSPHPTTGASTPPATCDAGTRSSPRDASAHLGAA
jgi:hypothetical protein